MFLAASPNKRRSAEDKKESEEKYKVGDDVLPRVERREKTLRERRVEDADRRLIEEVRDLSLREVGIESAGGRREERSRSHASRPHSSQDTTRASRNDEEREERRQRREERQERRHAREDPRALRPDQTNSDDRRRIRSEEARRIQEVNSRTPAVVHRQIEHQSSLRSLISSSDADSKEMEEEILRQIREEGLLDGIDLENIDVNQEDQISERIAEAFRRRQQERSRQEPARASATSDRRRPTIRATPSTSRDTSREDISRPSRRRRAQSTSPRSASQSGEPSRPPPAMSAAVAAHLEVHSGDEGRRRRRTTSSSRSSTAPVPVNESQVRPASRSQTDLSHRSQSSLVIPSRPSAAPSARSSADSVLQRSSADLPASTREQHIGPSHTRSRSATTPDTTTTLISATPQTQAAPPAVITVPTSDISPAHSDGPIDRLLMPAPLSPRAASHFSLSDKATALSSGSRPTSSSSTGSRHRSQLYPEPSITCVRCSKPHIEYELHYNCGICSHGTYNICLSCYRDGKGCLHWFGFGYTAWTRWEKLTQSGDLPQDSERPHMLFANRYIPPKSSPGGADGRKTLTTDDPAKRLQSGAFCANCLVWANECYWKCDFCNEGDWGFCNTCVNQGKSCTHALLPLTYKPEQANLLSPTQSQEIPHSATILTGPGVLNFGNFKPLTFSTECDICHYPIQPSNTRYHCFSCSSAIQHTLPGDYDICKTCYPKLVSSRRISAENGHNGWRRCPQGHRMCIVGFEDKRGGQCRSIVNDLVGGRGLHIEAFVSPSDSGLQKWSWGSDDTAIKTKLVTIDVMKTPPPPGSIEGIEIEKSFPPDGGVGMVGVALWSWYPREGATDELLFPKGAEIGECKNVNGDWFFGCYMGGRGLFPAPYVRIVEGSGGS